MSQAKWWNGFSLTKNKLANHYQQVLVNPSSKLWYNPLFLNSSNLDVEGLMLQENGLDCSWNNTLDLPFGNHYDKQLPPN